MYRIFPDVTYDWVTPLGQLIKRGAQQAWAWWLKTYVRFPLLRPVRYVYFVVYSFGPSPENRSGMSGSGMIEITYDQPLKKMGDIYAIRDCITQHGELSKIMPPTVVIHNWKLLHKQVFRQNAWHDTRRHPRPV